VRSWARTPCRFGIESAGDTVEIACTFADPHTGETQLTKRIRFSSGGSVSVGYAWSPALGDPADLFATELSLFGHLEVRSHPEAERWSFPIETVAKSERGLDRTRQGESLTLRWKLEVGEASIELDPAHRRRAVSDQTEVVAAK
jgi:hypothetical protein